MFEREKFGVEPAQSVRTAFCAIHQKHLAALTSFCTFIAIKTNCNEKNFSIVPARHEH